METVIESEDRTEISLQHSSDFYAIIMEGIREHNEMEEMMTFLKEVQLDNKTPSHLLHLMQMALGERILDDAILKHLWFNKLPASVKLPLSIVLHENVNDIAAKADTIMEIHETSSKQDVDKTLKGLCRKVNDLNERITKIEFIQESFNQRGGSSPHHPKHQEARSKSPPHFIREDMCWYHRQFGETARNCQVHCSWNLRQERSPRSIERHCTHSRSPRRLDRSRSIEGRPCWYHQRFGKDAANCEQPCTWTRGKTSDHHLSRSFCRRNHPIGSLRQSTGSCEKKPRRHHKESVHCSSASSLKRDRWWSPRHSSRSKEYHQEFEDPKTNHGKLLCRV